jgi:hypothetical protein
MISLMAYRRTERTRLRLPTTVYGVGRNGMQFVEQARTLDISPSGARLTGLSHAVEPGTVLGLQHGNASGRFRVVWVGEPGSNREGQIGVACVEVGQTVMRTVLYIGNGDAGTERHRRTLEAAGYRVLCRDFQAGMAAAQQTSFDAILVEHPLFPGDLNEAVSRLQTCQKHMRVLVLSTRPGALSEAATYRSYGLAHKGISAHELLARVEQLAGPAHQLKWPITRSSQRYAITTTVRVRLVRAGVVSFFEGRSSDMSEHGMAVTLPSAGLLPGEMVSIQFALPAAGDLCAYGTVRHCEGETYGIEFADLTETHREAIRCLCEVLPPLTAPRP